MAKNCPHCQIKITSSAVPSLSVAEFRDARGDYDWDALTAKIDKMNKSSLALVYDHEGEIMFIGTPKGWYSLSTEKWFKDAKGALNDHAGG